ncbi:MAG: chondroitinase family polysaccharide lyase [Victivallaceae bacterium]
MFRKVLTLLSALAALSLFAVDHGILDFENDRILQSIKSSGQISLSDRHYLGGSRSLRWDYKPGDTLEIAFPPWYLDNAGASKKFGADARTILMLNVYSEKAVPGGALRVDFGRQGEAKADCGFNFFLNFTGWRPAWVAYSRDMEGQPREDMNLIRFTVPAGIPAGTLYFDNLIPGVLYYERYQERDLQAPNVRVGAQSEYKSDPMDLMKLKAPASAKLDDADIAGFRQVENRLAGLLLGERKDDSLAGDELKAEFAKLDKPFAETGVKRHPDGRVTGRPLMYGILGRQYELVPDRKEQLKSFQDLRSYGALMYRIARLYRAAADPAVKQELKTRYLAMLDHLLDQGYAYGSSMGSRALVGYSSRELFFSFLLMRDMLRAEKRNNEVFRLGLWHCDLNSYLDPEYYTLPNADYFNILSRSALISILMLDDTPEKAGYLAAFSKFCSRNLGWQTPGWMGGIKPDGCAYHPWGHYPSYFFGGMNGGTIIFYAYAGSPWALSPEAVANLKRALKATFIYGNPTLATSLEGRVPFRKLSTEGMISDCFRLYGLTGDQEMAAIRLRLEGGKESAEFPGVKPAPWPQGHWSFNYGGFGIHRDGDKMVTLKGFNRYIWGSEIYRSNNRYGRYMSYGAISILGHGNAAEEGVTEKGWDWNRFPGTTARVLPWPELQSPVRLTEMRTLPDNRINGSSNFFNRYGMFGAIITEPDKPPYDGAFKAVKSVFAFGPRLIALGSDITASTPYPVETTLFQFPTRDGKRPGFFNSAKPLVKKELELTSAAPAWAADFKDNTFYVIAGGEVKFQRRNQESPDQESQQNPKMSVDNFNTAVIEHGVKPKDARYEVLIRLDLAPEAAADYAETLKTAKPYTVLRQDASVHAVHDRETGVTGAIFFAAAPKLDWELLRGVENPCYVMFRRDGDARLELSLNTPDLAGFVRKGFTDLEEVPENAAEEEADRSVTIRLAGLWQLAEAVPGVEATAKDGETAITGKFRHGIAYQLVLKKKDNK